MRSVLPAHAASPRGATGSRPPRRGPVSSALYSSGALGLVCSAWSAGFWQPAISCVMEHETRHWATLPRSFTLARHENRAYKAFHGLFLTLSPLAHLKRVNRAYGAFLGLYSILPHPSTNYFWARVALQEKSRATKASSIWGEETRTIFLTFLSSAVYALLSRVALLGVPLCYLHSNTVTKSTGVDFYTCKRAFMRIHIFLSRARIGFFLYFKVGIRVWV